MKKIIKIIKKVIKIIRIVFYILIAIVGLMLVLPCSRIYMGKCLKVEMYVKVNNEYVIPENIASMNGNDEQDIRVVNKADSVVVYISALRYGGNTVFYDVNTPEGVKHLTYTIIKAHDWGPREDFLYMIDLQQDEEGEWYADVWLQEKKCKEITATIWLSEDENAHVKDGP